MDASLLYLLTWVIAIASIGVSFVLKIMFAKYSKQKNSLNYTGVDVVKVLGKITGINLKIRRGSGTLTDYYDPRTETITLSPAVYDMPSIASIGVAAHEFGHAMQKHENYPFLRLRSLMVPVVNFGTNFGFWLFMIGVVLNLLNLAYLGLFLFGASVVFTLITLPVEFNASSRALVLLQELGLPEDELKKVKKVLIFAALTYVMAFASAVTNFLYMLSMLNQKDN